MPIGTEGSWCDGAIAISEVFPCLLYTSARHFIRQQQALGKEEGFIEEMINGQKVVKVFCHEEESKADFDKINDLLFTESETANKYANTLGPILNNIGNVLYLSLIHICFKQKGRARLWNICHVRKPL